MFVIIFWHSQESGNNNESFQIIHHIDSVFRHDQCSMFNDQSMFSNQLVHLMLSNQLVHLMFCFMQVSLTC